MPRAIECPTCGAHLVPAPAATTTTCRYCGTVCGLGPGGGAGGAPFPSTAPVTARHPQPTSSSTGGGQTGAAHKVLIVVGGVMLLGVGLGVVGFRMASGNVGEWMSRPCFVDANGDDVLDIAGLATGDGIMRRTVTVVDGADGSLLWKGESFPVENNPTMLCTGRTTVGVYSGDFHVRLYDATSSERPPAVVPLSDEVDRYGVGPDCLRIETDDDRVVSLALPTGQVIDSCNAEVMQGRSANRWSLSSDDDDDLVVAQDGTRWVLTARERGTPFLQLHRETEGRTEWTTDLRHIAVDSRSLFMQKAGDVLLVYAAEPSNDDYGVLIGVDATDGAIRYVRQQGTRWSGDLTALEVNPPYVVATWGCGLHAYDPATGERAWHIAGR